MSITIQDGSPGPGFWQRDNSHFPLPMSTHLWELFLPAYDKGTRRGLARYGSLIDHFDFVRGNGCLYLKTCFVEDAKEREARIRASEAAINTKLWRKDRADWQTIREQLRGRLSRLSEIDPATLKLDKLQAQIASLRKIFLEGTFRHFVQQPSSMFPVGDFVRNACAWTDCAPSDALTLLRGSHAGAANFESFDHVDEYADRIITGFDIIDLTLRELPQLYSGTLAAWNGTRSNKPPAGELDESEAKLRNSVPAQWRNRFDEALMEARAAYGLHDEDVRITYLWPLGLLRRSLLAAAGHLIDKGRIAQSDHIFQTTPFELDAMLAGSPEPDAETLAERMQQFTAWKDEDHPELKDGSAAWVRQMRSESEKRFEEIEQHRDSS